MATRGRKSAAALSVVPVVPNGRPGPPKQLTEEQAREWRAIIGRMPADWFTREVQPLLMAYCKHLRTYRQLSESIEAFDRSQLTSRDGLLHYDRLLAMREREVKSMATLATRMRLTPQSRYQPSTAKARADQAGSGRKPWEVVA